MTFDDHAGDTNGSVPSGPGFGGAAGSVAARIQPHRRERSFADEGPHPGSAIEWWFFQGSVRDADSGDPHHFMVSFIRSAPGASAESRADGHALVMAVLDSGSDRHAVSSWVDEPAVLSTVDAPGESWSMNVDRRLLGSFVEIVREYGPPRGVEQTEDLPMLEPHPFRVAWNGLRIEQRDGSMLLAFPQPECDTPWVLRISPACSRSELQSARRMGREGHGMELVSYPRLSVAGEVGGVPVHGGAWFDHQWGGRGWFFSDGDSGRVLGWEWLGINLDDGRDLVIATHRDAQTRAVVFEHAYLLERGRIEECPSGVEMTPLRSWESPRTAIRQPVSWRARVPLWDLDLIFEPLADDQEVPMFGVARALWEGVGTVRGNLRGEPVTGMARGEFYGYGFVFDFTDHLDGFRERIDAHIANFLPRGFEAAHVTGFVGQPRWSYEPCALTAMVADPVWDLISRRGKRWRPLFGLLLMDALGCEPTPYEELVSVFAELLHTGALIIDDIQDSSKLRRGEESIHLRYGDNVAISAANTLYFLPSVLVSRHPRLTEAQRLALHEITLEQLLTAHFGQALDVYWSSSMDPVHIGKWLDAQLEEKILQMYAQKTSAPLVALAKMSSVLAGVDPTTARSCVDFAHDLGVGFQIIDDVQNLGTTTESRKSCGEDLVEGKMTIVLFHALRRLRGTERARLVTIAGTPALRQSDRGLEEGIDLIRSSGALDVCRDQAEKMVDTSWRDLVRHLGASESTVLLRALWGSLLRQELTV